MLWPLAADPGAQTTLRRSTPSGDAPLSTVPGVETGAAPLRVAGIAPAHDPVPALEVSLPGGEPPHAPTLMAEGTPFWVAAVDGAAAAAGTALTLVLTVAAPGSRRVRRRPRRVHDGGRAVSPGLAETLAPPTGAIGGLEEQTTTALAQVKPAGATLSPAAVDRRPTAWGASTCRNPARRDGIVARPAPSASTCPIRSA